jgi:2,4-dienoyl-CoA reductase-like NADH-dependent reductase (Old Yellow Enzyme family)
MTDQTMSTAEVERRSDPALYEPFFRPIELCGGKLSLRNRLAMAPMTRRLAPDDRVPTPEIAAYYKRRAEGGVGLIVTEGTHIDDVHAPDSENVPGIFNEAQAEGWSLVTQAVHDAGGVIACQLWHTGRLAMRPIGPSPVPAEKRGGGFRKTPRVMTERDMHTVAHAFARGAELSKRAGFDAVEVHGAHGYLLDSFVSPTVNTRTDGFGGGFEQRMRFPLMVVRAVRAAVGDGYPIMYRFSQWRMDDYGALTYPDPETLKVWVDALREAGVDVLHVSTRDCTAPGFPGSDKSLAGWTRELSGLPTIAVGRVGSSSGMNEGEHVPVSDPAPAAALIEKGEADLVAVGRGLLANADWPEVVRGGRWRELRPFDRAELDTLDG